MSKRTTTIDDLTGTDTGEGTTYTVSITDTPGARSVGDKYEIDLSNESHAAFIAMLTGKTDEFHAYMRRALSTDAAPAPKRGPRTRGQAPANPTGNADETRRAREFNKSANHAAPEIKTWGRDHGFTVKDGPGTLPADLIVAFAKAHGMPESPAPVPPAPASDSTESDKPAD